MTAENTDQGQNGTGTNPEPQSDDKVLSLKQSELNAMMAENRRNVTKQNQEYASKLEMLQSELNLTKQQREELETTIESLKTSSMTKEELSKREQKKLEEKYSNEVKTLAQERDLWRNRFTSETIRRSLYDAGKSFGAYDESQIAQMLGPSTRLVEAKNEETGEPTLQVLVDFDHVDENGKPTRLQLSPTEAVKLMKETDRFANLFVAKGSPGLGGSGNKQDAASPATMTTEEYLKWRAKHGKQAYGR
jgi:hypothetical protein